MNKFFFLALAASCTFAIPAFAAVPQKLPDYQVSQTKFPKANNAPKFKVAMRLGLKGGAPM